MKRTPINKIGKQGKINQKINKEIAKLWLYHSIDYCEADFPHECDGMLTNAHRHRRNYYYDKPELAYNFNQVLRLCMTAHQIIDKRNPQAELLTEELFDRLRG